MSDAMVPAFASKLSHSTPRSAENQNMIEAQRRALSRGRSGYFVVMLATGLVLDSVMLRLRRRLIPWDDETA